MKEGMVDVERFSNPLDVDDMMELFGMRTLRSV
jgi:hypothetical protein